MEKLTITLRKKVIPIKIPKLSVRNLYWLAGILEGEGCFSYGDSPSIKIGNTDKDVVEMVGKLFHKHIRGPYKYSANKKPVYYADLNGANAIGYMRVLQPLLCKRRRDRITEIFERWNISPTKAHKLGTGRVPSCHKNVRHYAFGLCKNCYQNKRRQEAKNVLS